MSVFQTVPQQGLEERVWRVQVEYVIPQLPLNLGEHAMDEQAPSDNGHDAKFHNDQGEALAAQGKFGEATQQYKLATACDERDYVAWSNWGFALLNQNDNEEAIEKFARATQINDKYAAAYNGWGRALAALETYSEAVEKYRQAISLDDKDSRPYYNWAAALYDWKKYGESIEVCKKAVEVGHKDPDIYNIWGLGLGEVKHHDEAIEKYEQAVVLNKEGNKEDGRPYYNWGFSLAGLRQYQGAIEKFEESIKLFSPRFEEEPDLRIQATYARHSIAELFWRQGEYKTGRQQWAKTREEYLATKDVESKDADYFYNFGSMLQSVFGNLDEAEGAYEDGLKLDSQHVGILTSLVSLYIERKDTCINKPKGFVGPYLKKEDSEAGGPPATSYWKARESFVKAKRILEGRQGQPDDDEVFLQLGQLFLALGSYLTTDECEVAEKNLLMAFEKDKNSSDICANLGVLYARMENYQKAVRYLSDAVKLEPDDLTLRSNLAEALLKAESMERAEVEYKKVLDVTPYHVESHIGLGEVYKAMGDADDDADMYYRAIQEFNQGLKIVKTDSRSKKLVGKSLAAAYYSRGYARVKLYEVSKLARDNGLLHKARADFSRAKDNDPENYKANRAFEKLGKRFGFRSSQRFIEKVGPWILFMLSVGVFGIAQVSVLKSKPLHELNAGYYVLLTFGSLLWMVASIYLPQLLKIRVAGIELEKSAVEQITTPTALEISR